MTDRVRDRDDLLIEAGLALASERSLEAVLQRIVELAVDITVARYGAISVLAPDGRIQEFITEGITDDERALIGDPPTGHGILGLLISEARPLRLAEIAAHPMSVGFPAHHPPMRSLLGAPVLARGRIFGNIYVTEKQGDAEFSVDDERALQVLATQAGVAVENARLSEEMVRAQEEVRRLEMLDERERIAKELHDGVIQSLFAVGMSLQGAAALAQDPNITARIEGAVEDIDGAIRDLRNYIFGLRPGILADRQLGPGAARAGHGVPGALGRASRWWTSTSASRPALASIASDVVQVTREALSNVGRHAGATTCRVSLRRGPRERS